jgi:hypothetical protein
LETGGLEEEAAMKDDYLWDGSGEPDPEIQKLESTLGRFRHNQPAPVFDQVSAIQPEKRRSWFFSWRLAFQVAAAASILLAAFMYFYLRSNRGSGQSSSWEVARLAGAPRVDSKAMGAESGEGKLNVGQLVETDSSSRAAISLFETGTVEVDASSRVRLVANGPGRKRLSLERGTIHARIWAPPGEFVVDTPSAVAVDLGCVYTLHVDDSGAGLLRTTMGWVGFKLNGHESFIPAGAVCATRPKIGPGTPYFEDAAPAFREALTRFDFEAASLEERHTLLGTLVADARKKDALTLWHLLSRVSEPDRADVYDRLAALTRPPASVTREGILRLDRSMLDAWWDSLGYGDTFVWRTFERSWSQQPAKSD